MSGLTLKEQLKEVRARREFMRGYAYADEQLKLGALPAELERQADDAWEVTQFDKGIQSALRAHGAKTVSYHDLNPELQVAFDESLDKDQIDLSVTIRNTHAATLMQSDMDTWARIATRLEMSRDILASKHKAARAKLEDALTEAQLVRDAAIADMVAEQRAHRSTRFMAVAALVVIFGFGLAGWLL